MTEAELQKAHDDKLDERCAILGVPIPPFTLAKRALRGRRWTPRMAKELHDLIDGTTDTACDDRTF